MLSKLELSYIIQFLEELDERFSYDGCNDFKIPNTPENRELLKEAEKWFYNYSKDSSDLKEALENIDYCEKMRDKRLFTTNFLLLGYLIYKLKKENE